MRLKQWCAPDMDLLDDHRMKKRTGIDRTMPKWIAPAYTKCRQEHFWQGWRSDQDRANLHRLVRQLFKIDLNDLKNEPRASS